MIRRFTNEELSLMLDWYERAKTDASQKDHQLALVIIRMAGRRATNDLLDASIGHSDDERR
jgi:hypothetical protein